jgi:hypothetical protein
LLIILDATVLGLLTHTASRPAIEQCQKWFIETTAAGRHFATTSLIEFEVRRGLMHLRAGRQLRNLDSVCSWLTVLEPSRHVLAIAAALWADARRQGQSTASPGSLDVDTITGAHAQAMIATYGTVVVATENVRHLSRMADARHWRHIA